MRRALPFLFLLAGVPAMAFAAPRAALGIFDGWGAFRDPTTPRCYAIAAPAATIGTPQVDGWCDRGIALRPIPLAYPGFEAIKALAHYCPECKRDGVETVRVAFANRACRDCEPALRAKLERPGWCD